MRLAAALLGFALALPLAAEPIHVTGRVSGEKAGLSGVRVELFPAYEEYADALRRLTEKAGPAPIAKAVTDEDGAFEILAPESGCFRLVVRTEGYMAEEITPLPLAEDLELPPATLMRSSPMEVRTVGLEGRPLAGIEVQALDFFAFRGRFWGPRPPTWQWVRSPLASDKEGRVSIPIFPSYGSPAVAAVSPRFLGQTGQEKPGKVVILRLSPARSGWIEARDASGKPVPGTLARWKGWPVGITGADGRLEIAISEGEEAVTLESLEGWGARIPRAEGKGILPVRLSPPRRIAGRIVDSVSRQPVAGALVWSGSPLVAPAVRSGADGTFVLEIPAAEEGWMEARASGFLPGERQLAKKGPEPTVLTLAPSTALSGIVVDARGRPVAGVSVTTSYKNGTQGFIAMARSRADGEFRLTRLPPGGTFELSAARDGFARTTATARTAPAGQPSLRTRIVMADGKTAFGKVVEEGSRPVEGAGLILITRSGDGLLEAVSDAEGRFEFRHLSPGPASLRVTHPSHAPGFLAGIEIPPDSSSESPSKMPSQAARVDLGTIKLFPGETIEGRVTDGRGGPVEGAEVQVYPAEPRGFAGDWMAMQEMKEPLRTGPDGSFRAERLKGGNRYNLEVQREGFVGASVPGVPAPAQEPLKIDLKAARSLSGRVVGPEGEPVADAAVSWLQTSGPGGTSFETLGTSDADGRFRVTGFPPGTLSLQVQAEGYVSRRVEGLPIPGDRDPEDLRVTLERAITLEVQVLDAEGQPVPGVRVFAEPVAPRTEEEDGMAFFSRFGLRGAPSTDAAGRCRVIVAKPGSYWVSAGRMGLPVRNQVTVHAGSNSVEIRFPRGGEVSGRVVDENGAAVPRALVSLRQGEDVQQDEPTGADGTFVFTDVPDGDYRLKASQEARTSGEADAVVAGQPLRGLELRLDQELPGATLTGHVLGLPPEELSGLIVRAFSPGEHPAPVRTDHKGVYRFERLAPGSWRLEARDFEGRETRDTVEIPPGVPAVELDLEFPAGFTLTGRVLVDGAPLSGASVQGVRGKEGIGWFGQTAYDGTFRLRDLAAGPLTLTVSGPPGLSGARTLDLTESQDIKIELTTSRLAGTVVSATGEPVEDAVVRLVAWRPDLPVAFPESVARTGADGAFELPRLAAGSYKIKVSKEGFAPAETTAEVPPGGGAPPVSVLLKPQEGAP
jgi:protocatechuate 3,4-dioxygenase beta subunit